MFEKWPRNPIFNGHGVWFVYVRKSGTGERRLLTCCRDGVFALGRILTNRHLDSIKIDAFGQVGLAASSPLVPFRHL